MKHMRHWLMTAALLLCSMVVSAEDFSVDGIYYNITSETDLTVEVTYQGTGYSDIDEYSGDVTIPAIVKHDGKTYRVTTIGMYAFYGCENLISVVIPSSVTTINDLAFTSCSGLQSIHIPNSVIEIKQRAFQYCSSLSSLTLPEKLSNVAYELCMGCSKLESIVIPEGATYIGESAFRGCSKLQSANFPESLTIIGQYAFWGSDLATPIHIPANVTKIEQSAFAGCSKVTSLTFSEGITWIGGGAFAGLGISSLSLPGSLTVIDRGAFSGCPNLESVTFHESYRELLLLPDVFNSCVKITTIAIPEGVTRVYLDVFSNCSNLMSLELPSSVTEILGAFIENLNLRSFTVKCDPLTLESHPFYSGVDKDVCILRVPSESLEAYKAATYWNEFNNIVAIENTVDLGSCGDKLTWMLTDKDELIIGGTGTMADYETYEDTPWSRYQNDIAQVTIEAGVVSIGKSAFGGCTNLTSINIPANVTSIGESALAHCSNLKSIVVAEDNLVYDSRNECNAIIETWTNVLVAGCSTTTIPEDVVSIGNSAFEGCKILTDVVIPERVTDIGMHAFYDCSGLTSITCDAVTPPVCDDNAFGNVDKSITVYVSASSVAAYQAADGWKEFTNIQAIAGDVLATSLTIDVTEASLALNETLTLSATLRPEDATNPTLAWASSNEVVATVDEYGVVTAVGDGEATITVSTTDGSNLSASCKVTVKSNVLAVSLTLDVTEASLVPNETLTLTATLLPEDATNPALTWTSSNEAVATVDEYGVVTAVADGKATVTVSTTDGSNLSATCVVTVETKEAGGDVTEYDNTLSIDDMEARSGEQTVLSVNLENVVDITNLQFDLVLPEGITIAQDEDGYELIDLSTERTTARKHTIGNEVQADGSMRILCYSSSNAVFSGTEGEVLTITLDIDETMQEGDYTIQMKDLVLTEYTDGNPIKHTVPSVEATISVYAYTPGDVNNDGAIDVTDISGVVNFILNTASDGLLAKAADVNDDGAVDVTDISGVVNLILNASATAATSSARDMLRSAATAGGSDIRVTVLPFTLEAGEEKEIYVLLDNPGDAFTGIQFDLHLPEGISVPADGDGYYYVDLGSRTTNRKHVLPECSVQEDGSLRVLCYSNSNALFSGEEGDVLVITVAGDEDLTGGVYEMALKNVVLSRPDVTNYKPADYAASVLSGDAGEETTLTLKGIYTKEVLGLFSNALADNTAITSVDLTAGIEVDNTATLTTGNPNTIVYLAEGAALANESNVVIGDECANLVLTDGYAFAAPVAFSASQASYGRELVEGKYGTIVLPYAPDTDDYVFYALTSAGDDVLVFDEVETPVANTPYLYKLRDGKSAPQVAGSEVAVSSELTPAVAASWQMVGSYANRVIAAGEDGDRYYYAYTSSDNKIHQVTNTLTVKPYRAYFTTGSTSGTQLAIRTRGGEETTVIDNSQLTIDNVASGVVYDLQGRRVENPAKGIYIVNGKKVVK